MQLDELFSSLEAEGRTRRLPPIERWRPERVGSIDIHISAEGTWFHEGTVFRRPALVKLLSTVLLREDDAYYLVSPHEKLRISVADVPLLAVDFEIRGKGTQTDLLFTTNGGDHFIADVDHPIFMNGSRPYVHVRNGLEALIVRSAFYRLVEQGEAVGECIHVWSRGRAFILGTDDPGRGGA